MLRPDQSMLRLLGCLLETLPCERSHGLSHLVNLPAGNPVLPFSLYWLTTWGSGLQASHVLPLSMNKPLYKREGHSKFILTPCIFKNIMPVWYRSALVLDIDPDPHLNEILNNN